MTTLRVVLDHILSSIGPASEAQAMGARQRLADRVSPRASLGTLEALVERISAARHSSRPVVERKMIVICAADHGVADSGVDLGENSPTIVAMRHIAGGKAAVNAVARTAGASVVLVDCGVRGGDCHDLGPGVLEFRVGNGTEDITRGPAMTQADAVTCLQTGIALLFSLADEGLDVLALGHVSAGSQPVSGAITASFTAMSPGDFSAEDGDAITTALQVNELDVSAPFDVLGKVGGMEIGVMAGLILGAASISIPVVLDDHGTSAAALIAANLSPAVTGYMVASHIGNSPGHRRALEALGLCALFDLGLAQGEGTGAALALAFVDAAAGLLSETGQKPKDVTPRT